MSPDAHGIVSLGLPWPVPPLWVHRRGKLLPCGVVGLRGLSSIGGKMRIRVTDDLVLPEFVSDVEPGDVIQSRTSFLVGVVLTRRSYSKMSIPGFIIKILAGQGLPPGRNDFIAEDDTVIPGWAH